MTINRDMYYSPDDEFDDEAEPDYPACESGAV